MRAAVLEGVGKPLAIQNDIEIRDPGPGQVRVRVSNCGICHSDLSVIDGAFPAPTPIVLGHEASGVIDAVGGGVTNLSVGDPVVLTPCAPCGRCYWCVRGEASHCIEAMSVMTNTLPDGTTGLSRGDEVVYRGLGVAGFAEQVITSATGAVPIPREVPLETACVIGCAVQTGVGAVLNTARVEEGATVLVTGLGGIGQSIVQGARVAGASRILVSDPLASRREAARGLGATDLLDPTETDVVTAAMELTGGIGVDYAFEAAGIGALLGLCVNATRRGGTTVAVGAPPIDQNVEIGPVAAFASTGKRLLGCLLGSSNSLLEIPRLVSLWQSGRIDLDSLVTARRPLEQINEGLEDVRAGHGIRTVLTL